MDHLREYTLDGSSWARQDAQTAAYRLQAVYSTSMEVSSSLSPPNAFVPLASRLTRHTREPAGAGYWGSINTHRYTIWRYARKMRGRCFAVNYRKAPQFPWPCALQDCLAAYLYLINPPPHAKHRPVDPKNLIIAGDSMGGNLALS